MDRKYLQKKLVDKLLEKQTAFERKNFLNNLV